MIKSTASEVLAAWMVANGYATRPTPVGAWPVSKNKLPVEAGRDDWITIYDLDPAIDGKLMKSGETVDHPECQILIRSANPASAPYKGRQILEQLSSMYNVNVVCKEEAGLFSPETVQIQAVMIVMGLTLFKKEEQNQRTHYVATVRLTLEEVP